jgi:hypothetical protein
MPCRNVPGTGRAYVRWVRGGAITGQARQAQVAGRSRLASPMIALILGGLLVVLIAVDAPLARLAHQGMNASGGSVPVWLSGAMGAAGFVVAWRRPRNPLGWIFLLGACFGTLSEDASFYSVADYRLHHGELPLGWVAVLTQPGWAPSIALLGLAVLLFPDGALPSPRWRWVLRVYLAVAGLWIAGAAVVSVGAVVGHDVQVDPAGNLLALSGAVTGPDGWFGVVEDVFFPLMAVCWLASLAAQVGSYRRSSGERRQQLKWLLSGAAVAAVLLPVSLLLLNGGHGFAELVSGVAGTIGMLALPASMGVAIFKYRLYEIDRIISRTLAYAIVTGLLIGFYAGLVLLATEVFRFHSTVAVAASTLAAVALFSPVRRRVQRAVDRRFNRARYDAGHTVIAFAARLQDAVDLNSVRDDLRTVVDQALEPAHISVWINQQG